MDFYKTFPESDSVRSPSEPYGECILCHEMVRKREKEASRAGVGGLGSV